MISKYFLQMLNQRQAQFIRYNLNWHTFMPKKIHSFHLLIIVFCLIFSNLKSQTKLDSAKKDFSARNLNNAQFISTCFFIADEYMEFGQFDSAQTWLNRIYNILPVKKNSVNNYLLITRQAEIYYYNNNEQLGLQESLRGLEMAQTLENSLLIADSYNFLGLFYMNLDSVRQSISLFRNGIQIFDNISNVVYKENISKPYHLLANLAEAYFKLKMFDSSIYFCKKSLLKAQEFNDQRAISIAYISLGDVFFQIGNQDSSLLMFEAAFKIAFQKKLIDVMLIGLGGKAKCQYALGHIKRMNLALSSGISLLKKKLNINRYFSLMFLDTAISLYRNIHDRDKLIWAMELKSEVDKDKTKYNNKQVRFLSEASLANEKRLLNFEIEEANRKRELANIQLIMAIAVIIFLVLLFIFYRLYNNKLQTVSSLRQRLSQDLHDEIGSSLSSLQLYGTVAEQYINANPTKTIEMIQKINRQSRVIMEKMNDIVWSMKDNEIGAVTLETKIKNYAAELLDDRKIELVVKIEQKAEESLENIKARRNILLITKEILNNAAKHSKATEVNVQIYVYEKSWILEIFDNGVGIEPSNAVRGNGLKNIEIRTEELKGKLNVNSVNGTHYIIIFPLNAIFNTHWVL
jgi:signal transduction histidine kinase